MAESATMRSFRELDLGVKLWGRMRDEMLAGKEAKVDGYLGEKEWRGSGHVSLLQANF